MGAGERCKGWSQMWTMQFFPASHFVVACEFLKNAIIDVNRKAQQILRNFTNFKKYVKSRIFTNFKPKSIMLILIMTTMFCKNRVAVIDTCSYFVVVPDVIQDSNVAIQCREKDVVGWRPDKIPERLSGNPEVTNKVVTYAVAWHSRAVHLHNSGQKHQERRTHVYDALVNYQNAHRLHKNITSGIRKWKNPARFCPTSAKKGAWPRGFCLAVNLRQI